MSRGPLSERPVRRQSCAQHARGAPDESELTLKMSWKVGKDSHDMGFLDEEWLEVSRLGKTGKAWGFQPPGGPRLRTKTIPPPPGLTSCPAAALDLSGLSQ